MKVFRSWNIKGKKGIRYMHSIAIRNNSRIGTGMEVDKESYSPRCEGCEATAGKQPWPRNGRTGGYQIFAGTRADAWYASAREKLHVPHPTPHTPRARVWMHDRITCLVSVEPALESFCRVYEYNRKIYLLTKKSKL